MIGHLPSFGPDELLYSALARCLARQRMRSQRPAMKQIFARVGSLAVVDLPANLDAFVSMLPAGHSLDADKVIDRHSLFPYYEAFLPPERALKLRADLRGKGGPRVHVRIGLMAGRLRPPICLRYCRGCDAQDRDQGRDLSWRRLHQLTGVEVCPLHRMFFENGVGTHRQYRQKHHFIDPATARANALISLFDPNDSEHALFLRLAEGAEYLLSRGTKPAAINPEWLHERYVRLLCSRDLATVGGRLRTQEIRRLFAARYHATVLNRLQCGLESDWLDRLLRKPRGVQSPIRHLLMWDFLGFEASSFLEGEEVSLFGALPFPCLNPVCPQRGKLIITRCPVEHCRERHVPVAAVLCPGCGYDYRRLGPDLEASRRWDAPDWIADYGPLWRRRLGELWNDPGTSLREMARILGVDPITVKRQANKAGLMFPRTGAWLVTKGQAIYQLKGKSTTVGEAALMVRRKQWLALRGKYPSEGRKRLRLRVPAVWTALYRRDRTWLEANSPTRQKSFPADTRADWKGRDSSLCRNIEHAVERLRARRKPLVRLTFAALARELGAIALLQKHPHRLPLTVRKMNMAVENREQFALRRLNAVVVACYAAGECTPQWQLEKLAGLRADLCALPTVRSALDAATRLLDKSALRLPDTLAAA